MPKYHINAQVQLTGVDDGVARLAARVIEDAIRSAAAIVEKELAAQKLGALEQVDGDTCRVKIQEIFAGAPPRALKR